MTATTRRALRVTGTAALSLVVALIAAALAVLIVIPRATHGSAMNVLTGSMSPTIPTGSIAVVRPVDPATLHVGDVATYQKSPDNPALITHRIVAIRMKQGREAFIFKGDANRGPDVEPVPADAIRGKVWFHVPYLGEIRDSLSTKGGVGVLAVIVLLGYAISQVVSASRDRRAGTATTAAVTTPDTTPDLPRVERFTPAPSAAHDDTVVLLAVLPVAAFEGHSPRVIAHLLRAVLLEAEPGCATFTLLISRPRDRAARLVDVLTAFNPVRLEISDPSRASSSVLPRWVPPALPAGASKRASA